MSCVLYVLSGNSRSYQQWMHTVKVFTEHAVLSCCIYIYTFPSAFIFIYIIPELYLIESMTGATWRLKPRCCLWNEGAAWTRRSSSSAVGCVWSGACSRTVETDGEGDGSDLTWQDVLRHDVLIWQQTRALLRWTTPRTRVSPSFISLWPFPPLLLSVCLALSFLSQPPHPHPTSPQPWPLPLSLTPPKAVS